MFKPAKARTNAAEIDDSLDAVIKIIDDLVIANPPPKVDEGLTLN